VFDDTEPTVLITFSIDRTALDYLGRTFVRACCVILEKPDKDVLDFFSDTTLRKPLIVSLLEFYEPEFINRIYKTVPDIEKFISHAQIHVKSIKKQLFYEKVQQAVQAINLDYIQNGKNYGTTGPNYDTISNK